MRGYYNGFQGTINAKKISEKVAFHLPTGVACSDRGADMPERGQEGAGAPLPFCWGSMRSKSALFKCNDLFSNC